MTDELTELREQVAALAAEVTQLRAQLTAAEEPHAASSPMSRRAALAAIAGAAVGGAAVLVGAEPAAATTGTMKFGTINLADTDETSLYSDHPHATFSATNEASTLGVGGWYAAGLWGRSTAGCGVEGLANVGVAPSDPILGGVIGRSGSRLGVVGLSASNVGVYGQSNTGTAVQSLAKQGTGMYGVSVGGSGRGALGGVVGDSSANAGVVGFTSANARAAGEFVHTSNGRGATFKGAAAQARLIPTTAATHPASGLAGDLYVDKAKRLWFCKGASTWVQVA